MRAEAEFGEMLANLESPSSTLEDAVDEILGCETLTDLFLVILTTGNIINAVSCLLLSFILIISYSFSIGNVCW